MIFRYGQYSKFVKTHFDIGTTLSLLGIVLDRKTIHSLKIYDSFHHCDSFLSKKP